MSETRYCAQGFAVKLPEPSTLIRVVDRGTGEVVAFVPEGYHHWGVMDLLEGKPHKCYPDQPDDARYQNLKEPKPDV